MEKISNSITRVRMVASVYLMIFLLDCLVAMFLIK